MKLFLTSSGITKGLQKDFIDLIGRNPQGMRVAFILTAVDPEKGEKLWIQAARDQLQDLGVDVFDVDLKEESPTSFRKKLESADIIFVNGGNTFYLLDWIRKTGFDKMLPELFRKGKVYVGVSAGTYVSCPTIEHAHWKNADRDVVGLKDLSGLNLIPFIIVAHYTDEYKEAVLKGAASTEYFIQCLHDGQAVKVEDGKYEVVGEGGVIAFNEK